MSPAALAAHRFALLLLTALPHAAPAWAQTAGSATDFAAAVVRSGDAGQRSFAVVDKQAATLWVFDPRGRALGHTPVLLGQAVGDQAPADIGQRPLARIRPHEKITSAGRYLSEGGHNHAGEDIVWLDYDAALSMHRVRDVPGQARLRRLRSPALADKRISFGCINVPAGFYERWIDPLFHHASGVVYVLPETRPLASVFPFVGATAAAAEQR